MRKGLENKIANSIEFLKRGENLALQMNKEGYFLAFSGGKDSQVLLWLANQAGVKYRAYYSVTTNDPPANVRFIRDNYHEITFLHPKENFYKLVEKHGLPVMHKRFCCSILKETAGVGYVTLVGVRRAESVKRQHYTDFAIISKRKEHQNQTKTLEEVTAAEHQCIKGKDKILIRPMLEYTEADVWEIIEAFDLPRNPCYQHTTRVGCMFCPFVSTKQIEMYEQMYPRAKAKIIASLARYRSKGSYGLSAEEYYEIWKSKRSVKTYNELKKQTTIKFE